MRRPAAGLRLTAAVVALFLTGCAPPVQNVYYDPFPLPPVAPVSPALPEIAPVVPQVDLGLEGGLPDPANAVCMAAVGERAGDERVSVLGNETVAAGTEVTIGVGEQLARWRCVAGPTGEVVEISELDAPPG